MMKKEISELTTKPLFRMANVYGSRSLRPHLQVLFFSRDTKDSPKYV